MATKLLDSAIVGNTQEALDFMTPVPDEEVDTR
jgi:hypothetical protein